MSVLLSAAGAMSIIETTLKKYEEYKGQVEGVKLSRITKGLVVEPYVFVDVALSHQDFMPDVMQSLQSLFTATWAQGVSVLGNPSRLEALSVLDQANPSRDPNYMAFLTRVKNQFSREGLYWDPEAYNHGLPSNKSATVQIAKENAAQNGNRFVSKESVDAKIDNKIVNDNANLSVGKLIAVTIPVTDQEGKTQEHEFQVRIRLMAADLDQTTMTRFLTDKSEATSFKERFFDWRHGRIGILDLIFCNDLAKERKRQLLRDKGGIYSQVKERKNAAIQAGLTSGKASAAEATNMIVMSEAMAQRIMIDTGLDLDEYSDRQKIFDNTSAMIIVRVNPVDLRVRFYQEGSKRHTSVGVNELRRANKGNQNGPNLMELFENIQSGNALRF